MVVEGADISMMGVVVDERLPTSPDGAGSVGCMVVCGELVDAASCRYAEFWVEKAPTGARKERFCVSALSGCPHPIPCTCVGKMCARRCAWNAITRCPVAQKAYSANAAANAKKTICAARRGCEGVRFVFIATQTLSRHTLEAQDTLYT